MILHLVFCEFHSQKKYKDEDRKIRRLSDSLSMERDGFSRAFFAIIAFTLNKRKKLEQVVLIGDAINPVTLLSYRSPQIANHKLVKILTEATKPKHMFETQCVYMTTAYLVLHGRNLA